MSTGESFTAEKPVMGTHEMAKLALRCIDKKWDYEQLKYGDDLYGRTHNAELVWSLVNECEEIGTVNFKQKYGL